MFKFRATYAGFRKIAPYVVAPTALQGLRLGREENELIACSAERKKTFRRPTTDSPDHAD